MDIFLCVLLIIIGIIILSLVLYFILKSPFKYPYYILKFDVSGKRSPNVRDLIDEHINKYGFKEFSDHYENVKQWKNGCQAHISKCRLKKLRAKQYKNCLDDDNMFFIKLTRRQTRYKQSNYVKSAYRVVITVAEYTYSYQALKNRYNNLAAIGFQCTLSQYNSNEQRKAMTKALRDEIAKRDNYTCRKCGKYMPDGIGLHIDHIIPIKKGGKSIPSNLQVLCSKCNGQKGSS